MAIKVDQLANAIEKELTFYSEAVTGEVKKAVDDVAKEAVKDLKADSPRRSGQYAGDWTRKMAYENTRTKRNTVYNKGHYQLTHLLENGHAKRGGGRVGARVHIEPVEQKAIETLEQRIREVAK